VGAKWFVPPSGIRRRRERRTPALAVLVKTQPVKTQPVKNQPVKNQPVMASSSRASGSRTSSR
jgi:hypothetical protein